MRLWNLLLVFPLCCFVTIAESPKKKYITLVCNPNTPGTHLEFWYVRPGQNWTEINETINKEKRMARIGIDDPDNEEYGFGCNQVEIPSKNKNVIEPLRTKWKMVGDNLTTTCETKDTSIVEWKWFISTPNGSNELLASETLNPINEKTLFEPIVVKVYEKNANIKIRSLSNESYNENINDKISSSSLTLTNLPGEYHLRTLTCLAVSNTFLLDLNLTVQLKVYDTFHSLKDKQTFVGNSLTFSCTANDPSISEWNWFLNEKLIASQKTISVLNETSNVDNELYSLTLFNLTKTDMKSTLTLKNLTEMDAEIRCSALSGESGVKLEQSASIRVVTKKSALWPVGAVAIQVIFVSTGLIVYQKYK